MFRLAMLVSILALTGGCKTFSSAFSPPKPCLPAMETTAPARTPDLPPAEWWERADGRAIQAYIAYLWGELAEEQARRRELAQHVLTECR